MGLTGGCNCGAVQYAINGELGDALYCHCHRCQRRTGAAASPSVRVAAAKVSVTDPAGALRAWAPENGAPKWFCSQCGSAMWAQITPAAGAPLLAIRLGTFDADPGVRPVARMWCESAAAWEPIPADGLPHYPRTSAEGLAP